MNRLADFLATAGGVGRRFPAPGTAGSAVALLLYFAAAFVVAQVAPGGGGPAGAAAAGASAGGMPSRLSVAAFLFVVAFTRLGVWAATEAEKSYGHDAGPIVVDEVAGMWISLLFLPAAGGWRGTVALALIAFLFFRLFDIVKLFPANRVQHLRRGWGVMADDVVAGIYANIATGLVWRLLT